MDFTQTPPGMLALDNMLYFAKHHQDAYIRVRLPLFMEISNYVLFAVDFGGENQNPGIINSKL